MLRPVHFEIHADEPERAASFYRTVFGWKFDKWGSDDYWVVTTGDKSQPGIDGGLMKRRDPSGATYNTMDVPSVDEYLQKIIDSGGKIVVPKMAIPTVGYLAYCNDTEGNVFGVYQEDKSAK